MAGKLNQQARSQARERALQGLYQWEITGNAPLEIIRQFLDAYWENIEGVDRDYFCQLMAEVPQHSVQIDALFAPYLDRDISQLDPIERCILRLSTYELQFCQNVPWKAVLNEGVNLAKIYGADQSHKFINGILDKVAHQLYRGVSWER